MPEMQVTSACHSALLLTHGMQFCTLPRLEIGAAAWPAPMAGSSRARTRKLRITAAQAAANTSEACCSRRFALRGAEKKRVHRTLSYLPTLIGWEEFLECYDQFAKRPSLQTGRSNLQNGCRFAYPKTRLLALQTRTEFANSKKSFCKLALSEVPTNIHIFGSRLFSRSTCRLAAGLVSGVRCPGRALGAPGGARVAVGWPGEPPGALRCASRGAPGPSLLLLQRPRSLQRRPVSTPARARVAGAWARGRPRSRPGARRPAPSLPSRRSRSRRHGGVPWRSFACRSRL